MSKLLIIDGNALMHRCYHALPKNFRTKSGFLTNAVYGFFSILRKSIFSFKPNNLVVCFDTPKPTFRKKIFEDYKKQRPKTDEELINQFATIREALETARIYYLEKPGFEADDLIGTIAKKFSQENNHQSLILTGDKDILQLVDRNILVISPQIGYAKEKIYTEEEVKKKFLISPKQMIDLKALMGDQADNYQGAKGIGPKTASRLLNKFESVENIYRNIENTFISPRIKQILIVNKENVFLSQKLAKILTDVDIEIDFERTEFSGFNEKLKSFFLKYEMYSMLRRFFPKEKKKMIKPKIEEKKKISQNQIKLF